MNTGKLALAFLLIITAQVLAYYQIQGQFVFKYLKNNLGASVLMSIPAAICGFYATKLFVEGFEGLLWPARMIGFAVGIIIFTCFTFFHLNELPDKKTIVTIILAGAIIAIQLGWK